MPCRLQIGDKADWKSALRHRICVTGHQELAGQAFCFCPVAQPSRTTRVCPASTTTGRLNATTATPALKANVLVIGLPPHSTFADLGAAPGARAISATPDRKSVV